MSGTREMKMQASPTATDRVRDPARLAVLRSLCLEDGRTNGSFDRLTRLAAKFLRAPAALVNLVEHDRQVTRSAYGEPDRFRRGDEAPLADSICQLTVQTGEPVVIADARADIRVRGMQCVASGVAAYAGVPLTLSSGHSLGSLCVVDVLPREWTDEEIAVLRDLAAAVTTELELCAAHRAAEARTELVTNARQLQAIESITDVALTQSSLDDTLHAILGRLRDILRADTATVLLLSDDGSELVVRASLGLESEVAQGVTVPVGQGISGRIAASREPMIVDDVTAADAVSPVLRATVHSLVGAPLLLGDTLTGVVHVGTTTRRTFDEDDLRLLTLAAARISAAVDRARLFDAEHAARMAAEAASRAKSEFLAVMSHELRTPLNAIDGYAQLLEEGVHGPLTKEQRRAIERIRVAQARLSRGIQDILRWVDIERARVSEPPVPMRLRPILQALEARLAAAASAAGLHLDVEPCAEDVHVLGDPAVVSDILARVADNAVKFTPAGGRVSVRCEASADRVVVSVADTGIGIPEERLKNVFEPFEQVDTSYRRAHEGIGLGLAIARALARRIGAELAVQRVPAGGTVLTLSLQRTSGHRPGRGRD